MSQALFLSKPGVHLPATAIDNAEILRRVRARFRGNQNEWSRLASAIERMFELCNTRVRFQEQDPNARVADYAVAAARQCLERNRAALEEVDLVLFGGIARQYFEPATAVEIAAKLGLKRTHAFDVTTACVGHLQAVETAAAYLRLHPSYRSVLVCTAELSGDYLSYDIQGLRDLTTKFAGLTIGNGAACMLLRREPWPLGSLRLDSIRSCCVPAHWELCQVPIGGTLVSSSSELMRLGALIPPLLHEALSELGWTASEIDHFVVHQPSETEARKTLELLGTDAGKAVYTHRLFGNTASASVGLTFDRLLEAREVRPGDKLMLASAAAGFSLVVALGTWMTAGATLE